VAYIFAIATYVAVTIPSLRTIVEPVPDVDTAEDRVEAMRVLSAGNTIMMVLLGAILTLQVSWSYHAARIVGLSEVTQAGQEYVKRLEAKGEEERKKVTTERKQD
jgi:hypothetical protein